MKKKGVSPLIATVLLIGFTVVLGVLVFNWIRGLTEGTMSSSGTQVETTMKCAGVDVGTLIVPGKITVTSEGSTLLCGFKYEIGNVLNEGHANGKTDGNNKVCIGYSSVNIVGCDGKNVKIIPTIKINEQIIDCPAQAVTVKC